MRLPPVQASVACVLVLLSAAAAARQRVDAPPREIAITIDDLPTASVLGNDLAAAERTTRDLLAALARHHVPAIGFVNETKLRTNGKLDERRVALLRQWIAGGLELGNHTFAHIDFHTTPLADYEREVLDGEKVTKGLLRASGRDIRYFRHPFLHTARSAEVRDSFDAFLKAHGYTVAPVTVDNYDYIFAAAYDRAAGVPAARLGRGGVDGARGEADAPQKIASAYIDYMEAVVAYYEQQSIALLGRELRQTLLMHASALNAATFDRLATMLEGRGYRFITLDRALEDPAYSMRDEYYGPGGITWLHRWALTQGKRGTFFAGEPPVPDWIERASRAE
jgi:peptidoglycan/xylan/chitin deacetylase (PgdA/CDA1 family)